MMDVLPSRDGRAASLERKFTKDVIRAIEHLELRRATRSAQQLADAAWSKLQYDLPVVEPSELSALVERLRCSLHGKVGWPCYALTEKALENILGGARRSICSAPNVLQQEQQLQQQLSDSINASVAKHGSKYNGDKVAASAQVASPASVKQQQAGCSVQYLYQQLCIVVLLQYVAKVVSLSEQDAWQLLQHYHPQQELAEQHQQEQQLSAQLLQTGCAPTGLNGSAGCIYDVTEAAVQDNDSEAYEALDTTLHAPDSVSNIWQQKQQQPYSWLELRSRLLGLSNHVQYQVMCQDTLWQQQAAAEHVLEVLRGLGAHNHAAELQPMVHAYAGLLVDRIAAAPAEVFLLQQLWDALGLGSQGCASSSAGSAAGARRQQQAQQMPNVHLKMQTLPAEAVLGLTAAASVWQQVPGSGSRSKVWRLLYHNLPLLEQCMEQLAYCSSSTKNGSILKTAEFAPGINDIPAVQQQQVEGEKLAHILLVSYIIELLLLGRPLGVDVADQFTQMGVTRSLVQLFVQHCGDIAVEPLRRALLLCCCASQRTAGWVLAVPAVRQQLHQPIFQLAGPAEAHGALWEMLISKDRPQVTAAAVAGAAGSVTCCQLMLSLLQLLPNTAQQLQRQIVLLQVMCDVQQAAGKQIQWEEEVKAAVKHLTAEVKDSQATVAAVKNVTVGVVQAPKAVPTGFTAGNGASGPQCDAEDADLQDSNKGLQKATSAEVVLTANHEQQHLQQHWLTILKYAKQLMTHGGKTD